MANTEFLLEAHPPPLSLKAMEKRSSNFHKDQNAIDSCDADGLTEQRIMLRNINAGHGLNAIPEEVANALLAELEAEFAKKFHAETDNRPLTADDWKQNSMVCVHRLWALIIWL